MAKRHVVMQSKVYKQHNSTLKQQRGYSLLEQAIALPVLLLLIVGIVDVTHVVQGYNAIKRGVDASIRCIYPTDGECVEVSPDTRERIVSVTRITRSQDAYGSEMNYSGLASWFSVLRSRYDHIFATVFASVSYEAPLPQFEFRQETRSDPNAYVPYVVKKYTLPYLSGSISDVRFGSQNHSGSRNDYPDDEIEVLNHESIGGETSVHYPNSVSIGNTGWTTLESPFTAENKKLNNKIYENLPCFESSDLDGDLHAGHAANFAGICDTERVNIVVWVQGQIGSQRTGKDGNVLLDLEIDHGNRREVIPLGGRMIKMVAGSNDDFLPRGLMRKSIKGERDCIDGTPQNPEHNPNDPADSYERVDADLLEGYECEARLHSDLKVPWDKPFRFRFRLQSYATGNPNDDTTVSWNATTIKFARSVYESRIDEISCPGTYTVCSAANQFNCQTSHPAGPARDIVPSSGRAEFQTIMLPCGLSNQQAAQDYVAHTLNCPGSDLVRSAISPTCGNQPRSQQCPVNFGHPDSPANDGQVTDNSSIGAAICPITDPDLVSRGLSPINPLWRVARKRFNFQPMEWTPSDCHHLVPLQADLPAEVQNYAHLTLGPSSHSERTALFTLPISSSEGPAVLKERPEYACSHFTVAERIYDGNKHGDGREKGNDWIPDNSLFVGFHPNLGCNWKEILREAAESDLLGEKALDTDCYFDAQVTATREVRLPAGNAQSNDSCTYIRYDGSRVDGEEFLGNFPEGQIPEFCLSHPAECRIKLVSISNGSSGDIIHNSQRAIDRIGIPTVRAYYPSATFGRANCNDAFCAEISELNQADVNREHATLVGRLNVPSYLLRALGRDHFQVSYRAQERYEEEFAD